MSDLGWKADGIARARAAGGIELERYRRPGFRSEIAVRRSAESGGAWGIQIDAPGDADPSPVEFLRRKGRR